MKTASVKKQKQEAQAAAVSVQTPQLLTNERVEEIKGELEDFSQTIHAIWFAGDKVAESQQDQTMDYGILISKAAQHLTREFQRVIRNMEEPLSIKGTKGGAA
jgi:hypothetical protein